jgi:hypothetical protein
MQYGTDFRRFRHFQQYGTVRYRYSLRIAPSKYGTVRYCTVWYGTSSAWYVTVWYATEALGMAREGSRRIDYGTVPVPVRCYCTVLYCSRRFEYCTQQYGTQKQTRGSRNHGRAQYGTVEYGTQKQARGSRKHGRAQYGTVKQNSGSLKQMRG